MITPNSGIIASFHGIWSLAGFGGAALGALMVSFHVSPGYHFLVAGLLSSALVVYAFPGSLHQHPGSGRKSPGSFCRTATC